MLNRTLAYYMQQLSNPKSENVWSLRRFDIGERASATKMEIQARQELREKQQKEASGEDEDDSTELLNLVEEATSGILLDLIA